MQLDYFVKGDATAARRQVRVKKRILMDEYPRLLGKLENCVYISSHCSHILRENDLLFRVFYVLFEKLKIRAKHR